MQNSRQQQQQQQQQQFYSRGRGGGRYRGEGRGRGGSWRGHGHGGGGGRSVGRGQRGGGSPGGRPVAYATGGGRPQTGRHYDGTPDHEHPLVKQTRFKPDWGCDICRTMNPPGVRYGCRPCDWDMCSKCWDTLATKFELKAAAAAKREAAREADEKYAMAKRAFAAKDFLTADYLCDEILGLCPGHRNAVALQMEVRQVMKEAEALMRDALGFLPHNMRAAEDRLVTALEVWPECKSLPAGKAKDKLEEIREDMHEAKRLHREALQEFKKRHDFGRAWEAISHARELFPDYAEAIQLERELSDAGALAHTHMGYAQAHADEANHPQVIAACARALENWPGLKKAAKMRKEAEGALANATRHCTSAWEAFRARNNFDKAKRLNDQALHLFPSYPEALELQRHLQDAETTAETYMARARSHRSYRDHPQVLAACGQALQAWPRLGEAMHMQKEARDAMATAEEQFEQARRLLNLTELTKADAHCSKSLAIFPAHEKALALQPKIKIEITSAEQLYMNARAYCDSKELLKAEQQCTEALVTFRSHAKATELSREIQTKLQRVEKYFADAAANFKATDLRKAQEACTQALLLFPTHALTLDLEEKVKSATTEARAHLATAQMHFGAEDFLMALEALSKALIVFATFSPALDLRFRALEAHADVLKSTSEYTQAASHYSQAIEVLPDAYNARDESESRCHNSQGECLMKLNRCGEAVASFEMACSREDCFSCYRLNLAKASLACLFQAYTQGRPVDGQAFQYKVSKLHTILDHLNYLPRGGMQLSGAEISEKDKLVHQVDTELEVMFAQSFQRGEELVFQEDYVAAHKAFSESLSTEKGDRAEVYYRQGLCWICQHQTESAVEELSKCLQLAPAHKLALFERGCCYRTLAAQQQGQPAVEAYTRAVTDIREAEGLGHEEAKAQLQGVQEQLQVEQIFTAASEEDESRCLDKASDLCKQALALNFSHTATLALQQQVHDKLVETERHYESASEHLAAAELMKADKSCTAGLAIFPNHQQTIELHAKVKTALTTAEQHYSTAASTYAECSLVDVSAMRRVQEECSHALQIFVGHQAALELKAKAQEGLKTDDAFQRGKAAIRDAQYASAAANFAEAASLLSHSGDMAAAGPVQLRVADCYIKMAECDTQMFSPPASAEALYSRAIDICSDEAYSEQKHHQLLRIDLFKARGYVKHAHGNLPGAAEDIEHATSIEQRVRGQAAQVTVEEGVPPPQLEFMFADASLLGGVGFLRKAARANPLRWHGGTAQELVAQLSVIVQKGGEDAGKPIQLRHQSQKRSLQTPEEVDAGRPYISQGAIELTLDTPAAARDWITGRFIDTGTQPEPESPMHERGGTVDTQCVGASMPNIVGSNKEGASSTRSVWLSHLRDESLLTRMARAPQNTSIPVEVFLNERWVPTRGFSSGHLLSSDVDMFTHRDGGPQPGYRGERHGTPADDDLQLPAGWQFEDQWTPTPLGRGMADKEGFEYATGWDKGDFSPSSFATAVVRRQRLVRTAVKVLPVPTMETVPLMHLERLCTEAPQLPLCNLARAGFLNKEGAKIRNWKRRWFVLHVVNADGFELALDQLELRYFDYNVRGEPTNLKGSIKLNRVTSVSDSKPEQKARQGDKLFTIDLSVEDRIYHLQAGTDAEHEDWLQALSVAVRVATGQQDRPRAPTLSV